MRLSEAIRLGAMLHPQSFGDLLGGVQADGFDKSKIRRTCALGAAWVASGRGSEVTIVETDMWTPRGFAPKGAAILRLDWPAEWQETFRLSTDCPEAGCGGIGTLSGAIQHLNDHHRWTREQIADFVERVESPASAAALDPSEASNTGTLTTRA